MTSKVIEGEFLILWKGYVIFTDFDDFFKKMLTLGRVKLIVQIFHKIKFDHFCPCLLDHSRHMYAIVIDSLFFFYPSNNRKKRLE